MIERSEELVTVFGGGGFIGRYVCEFLLRAALGSVSRSAIRAKPISSSRWARSDNSACEGRHHQRQECAPSVHGASAVVNLCGVFGPKMQRVHVDGARNMAEAARSLARVAGPHLRDRRRPQSESAYGRTKAEGEEAVRNAFPQATIIRPSLVFGPEDELTNRFAGMARLPFLPVIAAKRNFQPVYVRDLGKAIAMAVLDPAALWRRDL